MPDNNFKCPFHENEQRKQEEFRQLCAECKQQIEADMTALGLLPEKFVSAIRMTSTTMARYLDMSMTCASLPLTYTEVSREGNRKPVSRPEFATLNAVGNSLTVQLKQLGIYVATNKVDAKVKDDEAENNGLLSVLGDE